MLCGNKTKGRNTVPIVVEVKQGLREVAFWSRLRLALNSSCERFFKGQEVRKESRCINPIVLDLEVPAEVISLFCK